MRQVSFSRLLLYEQDYVYLRMHLREHLSESQLQAVSFRRTVFKSSNTRENGEISDLNLSYLFKLPQLKSLDFSYSNILKVLTREEIAAFYHMLKGFKRKLEYFGLKGVCVGLSNCSKYYRIL